jgi:predicted lipoprotein with Yx(FWY)xxD motif
VTRSLPAIAILAIGALLVVAGCGGSSNSSSSSGEGGAYGSGGETGSTQSAKSETGGGEAASGGDGTVTVATSADLGPILVDSKGFTLYDFHKDKGTESACYGACASTWPPLTAKGSPHAKGAADASQLGTTKRSDGTVQVTYAGHPLYTYVADTKPGETKGNDFSSFGAQWYALKANGQEAGD